MNIKNILVSMSLVTLAACGGGGGAASAPASSNVQPASVPPPVVNAPPVTANADLVLAARLYKGDERTPTGFDVESRPANVVGTLSTRHLKNTDFSASNSTFEMCTNDMAQAIDWSERQASYQGQ